MMLMIMEYITARTKIHTPDMLMRCAKYVVDISKARAKNTMNSADAMIDYFIDIMTGEIRLGYYADDGYYFDAETMELRLGEPI